MNFAVLFLPCLFFMILCAEPHRKTALGNGLCVSGYEGFNLTKHNMQEEEAQERQAVVEGGKMRLHGKNEEKIEFESMKGKRGKGAYGGANVVDHKPHHTERAAASSLLNPTFSVFTAMKWFSFGIINIVLLF